MVCCRCVRCFSLHLQTICKPIYKTNWLMLHFHPALVCVLRLLIWQLLFNWLVESSISIQCLYLVYTLLECTLQCRHRILYILDPHRSTSTNLPDRSARPAHCLPNWTELNSPKGMRQEVRSTHFVSIGMIARRMHRITMEPIQANGYHSNALLEVIYSEWFSQYVGPSSNHIQKRLWSKSSIFSQIGHFESLGMA